MADMDPNLRRLMLAYYDERAHEYDEVYALGTGSASIPNPEAFTAEVPALGEVVERIARGRLMDLACGTAYWLPRYAPTCSQITLFDQSARMLAESRARADRLGVVDRCVFLHGDVLEHDLAPAAYDTVLVGFLLSHLTNAQEQRVFEAIQHMLAPTGQFVILDSAWTPERAKYNARVERQPRQLNDGTAFEIYKRYLDRDDFARWTREYAVTVQVEHFGSAWLAVSGHARDASPGRRE